MVSFFYITGCLRSVVSMPTALFYLFFYHKAAVLMQTAKNMFIDLNIIRESCMEFLKTIFFQNLQTINETKRFIRGWFEIVVIMKPNFYICVSVTQFME